MIQDGHLGSLSVQIPGTPNDVVGLSFCTVSGTAFCRLSGTVFAATGSSWGHAAHLTGGVGGRGCHSVRKGRCQTICKLIPGPPPPHENVTNDNEERFWLTGAAATTEANRNARAPPRQAKNALRYAEIGITLYPEPRPARAPRGGG
jgi:hypothetical protein